MNEDRERSHPAASAGDRQESRIGSDLISPFGGRLVDLRLPLLLVNQADLRTKMGENARRLAEERFDVAKINRELLAVYESLLNPAGLAPTAPAAAAEVDK